MRGSRTVFNESSLQPESGSSGAAVTLPTLQRNQSVLFTVQYVLTAAVTRFSAQCDGETEVPPENERVNVIRWRTGSWEPTFERMNVSFVTDNGNASFSVASAPNGQVIASSTRNSTTIMWLNVSTAGAPIEVLVAERGTQQCPQELECFPGGRLSTGIIVVIVLAIALPLLCIECIRCFGGRRSGGGYGSSYVGGGSGGGGGGGCGGGGGGG
ncbi:Histone-lysine N-methyltransferase trithorax [Gracilaria domingensis]|nr:Histone-lysine N-methyltransferase trithorax [Gracilaria domingensis]